jgi:hypothetical protein
MIPELIQRRGAVHGADKETQVERSLRLDAPPSILELVPEAVARENMVFPIALDGETLTLAAVDPGNLLLVDKLSFILNKKVRLVGHSSEAIWEAIERHYGSSESESVSSCLSELTDSAIAFGEQSREPRRNLRAALHDELTPAVAPPARRESRGRWLGETVHQFKKGMLGVDKDRSQQESRYAGNDDGNRTMWYYTVEEGQRALVTHGNGRIEVIVGPRRVWAWGKRFAKMKHFVAHPGEFLIVRFEDGQQQHVPGPADLWFDPRVHEQVTRQESLQLAAKEAVIVYTQAGEDVSRRIVYGPTLFVPAPGEWLHTFQWHGSEGGSQGVKKVAKGLVFQKLWLMPDQMYHDVTDVRTADDAVLMIRLMIFFELVDIERMLEATHDPIGDFINAATSDVVDFTSRRTFEAFKQETGRLNEIETYRQLAARASQNGYRVNKVVYRGYGAPDRLQAMQDQAIEARTKLQLERATEEQAQNLEDYKLNAQMNRASRRRIEQGIEVETELEMARKRQEAELRHKETERTAGRELRRRDAEAELEIRRQADERQRQHLSALREMGVDLTAFLTQGRADRVIELRGNGVQPHLHLEKEPERNGS